jgi:hypothetical protein
MKVSSIFLSVTLSIILSACGGGGSSEVQQIDLTDNSQSDRETQKVTSTSCESTSPLIQDEIVGVSTINEASEWQLSSKIVPKFTKLATDISDFSTIVYPNHPRLYFRDTDIEYLKNKLNSSLWSDYRNALSIKLPKTLTTGEAIEKLDAFEDAWSDYARIMILAASLEEDSYYQNLAISWAMALAANNTGSSSDDTVIRRRVERLSEVYDWLYDVLTDGQKKTIRVALKRDIDNILTFGYMSDTENFIQKHSRWARGVVAQGLLVMYGDFDENFTKAYADRELAVARQKLLEYQEVDRYIIQDGGFHLGWMYAATYGGYTYNYLAWSTGTKETFLNDWMGELSSWFIYGLRGDESLPTSGDSINENMSHGIFATLYNAKFKNDSYSKWYLEKKRANAVSRTVRNVFEFLLSEDTVTAKAPDALSKSRLFKGPGVVIAKDRWDSEATQLVFKASSFYNSGHHHRDENSFALHYKVPLALDTGIYDISNSEHYKNYYTRTVAHNAVTVYNPNQKMYFYTDFNADVALASKLISNDGGQVYKKEDSMNLEDIVSTGKNHLGGISHYEDKESYTYMKADETKAYDPATVSLEQREIFYVRDSNRERPVVVVYDRIEATSGEFQKRYLLHVDSDNNDRPNLSGNKMRVLTSETRDGEDRSAKLTNVTIYPEDATLSLVGGEGSEFVVGTKNYPPLENGATTLVYGDVHTKVGNWRLEVSPPLGNKYDVMLNVLFPDDPSTSDITDNDAKKIISDSAVGVEFTNRVFVFPKLKQMNTINYVIGASNKVHTIATGLACGTAVSYKIGDTVQNTNVGEGGCLDFPVNTNQSTIITISVI